RAARAARAGPRACARPAPPRRAAPLPSSLRKRPRLASPSLRPASRPPPRARLRPHSAWGTSLPATEAAWQSFEKCARGREVQRVRGRGDDRSAPVVHTASEARPSAASHFSAPDRVETDGGNSAPLRTRSRGQGIADFTGLKLYASSHGNQPSPGGKT